MKQRVFVAVVLLCCLFLVSCTASSPKSSGAQVQSSQFSSLSLVGTIVYEELEGGFYILETDDGKPYIPIDLDDEYKKDGLRVHVEATLAEDMMGIQMRGQMITIQSIISL